MTTPTPEQRAQALADSIAHWKRMRAMSAEAIEAGTEEPTTRFCALCDLFVGELDETGRGCVGCPVSEKTGLPRCTNTPYSNAYWAWCRVRNNYSGEAMLAWHAAADAEIAFLESLVEKAP